MKKENVNTNIKNKAHYQGLKTKHINAAKDAASSGDCFLSEYNLQFAERYGRIISERFNAKPPQKRKIEQNEQITETQKKEDNLPKSTIS